MTGMEFLILKELSGLALAVGAGLGVNINHWLCYVNCWLIKKSTQKKTRRSGLGEGTKKPARGGLGY